MRAGTSGPTRRAVLAAPLLLGACGKAGPAAFDGDWIGAAHDRGHRVVAPGSFTPAVIVRPAPAEPVRLPCRASCVTLRAYVPGTVLALNAPTLASASVASGALPAPGISSAPFSATLSRCCFSSWSSLR